MLKRIPINNTFKFASVCEWCGLTDDLSNNFVMLDKRRNHHLHIYPCLAEMQSKANVKYRIKELTKRLLWLALQERNY